MKIGRKRNDKNITDHMTSLIAAAELSIKMLVQQNFKNDLYLVLLIACLPGGVTEDQIDEMTHFDLEESLARLNQLSLFEDDYRNKEDDDKIMLKQIISRQV